MYDDYAEFQRDLDDRDDRDDRPTQSFYDGDFCEHGKYVGGCGIDWMCYWCEEGISAVDAIRIITAEKTRATRTRAENAAKFLSVLLTHGMGGMDAAHLAQETSRVGNPPGRYGRH
jgi:hypothetical protein